MIPQCTYSHQSTGEPCRIKLNFRQLVDTKHSRSHKINGLKIKVYSHNLIQFLDLILS